MKEEVVIEILRRNGEGCRFNRAIEVALKLLSSEKIDREDGPNALLHSSREVAELHDFRRRSGYYNKNTVVGLDETIEALALHDVAVRLGVIETRGGYIGIWLDQHDGLLGVIVFNRIAGSDIGPIDTANNE